MPGPENVRRLVKGNGHFIASRKTEIVIGCALFIIGSLLLWDAFNGRGRNAPWPFGGILPF